MSSGLHIHEYTHSQVPFPHTCTPHNTCTYISYIQAHMQGNQRTPEPQLFPMCGEALSCRRRAWEVTPQGCLLPRAWVLHTPTPHPFLPPCLTQACEHGRRPLTALSPDLTRCRDAHWCRLREGCPLTGPCPYPGVILTLFTAWQETVGESHKRGWKILKWGETRAECSLGREACGAGMGMGGLREEARVLLQESKRKEWGSHRGSVRVPV